MNQSANCTKDFYLFMQDKQQEYDVAESMSYVVYL